MAHEMLLLITDSLVSKYQLAPLKAIWDHSFTPGYPYRAVGAALYRRHCKTAVSKLEISRIIPTRR